MFDNDVSEITFAYSQFLVYDSSVTAPGLDWTELHVRQGFARRHNALCMGTLLEFGNASVRVFHGRLEPVADLERVVEVTLVLESGAFVVHGPDDFEAMVRIEVPPGSWRLTIGQRVSGEYREDIVIGLRPAAEGEQKSEILVRDAELEPPDPLIESAEVMRVD